MNSEFAEQYLKIITTKFQSLNLTRIMDPDELLNKQVLDATAPIGAIDDLRRQIESVPIIVDVGFGGGFPILPLASMYPGKKFIGFEARRKKVDAVNEIASDLNLTNVTCYHERIENILIDTKALITFKAVSTVDKLLPLINSKDEIIVWFYKGPNAHEKENIVEKYNNFVKTGEHKYLIKDTDGRMLISYKNNVPRGTAKIKNIQNLVKLSELL